ncbi:hypothetical protein [Leifsonia sp. AG29]|uniref:hypothetical protein n=1 Tax=Leifsonia sp. AG29 TaxID=2598860 RepID=UPI00131D85CF|nr:hypothetical protein [Leifsonia sp. AG29]
MNAHTNITLSAAERAEVVAYSRDGVRRFRHMTRPDKAASRVGAWILGDLSLSEWLALSDQGREARLYDALLERNLAAARAEKDANPSATPAELARAGKQKRAVASKVRAPFAAARGTAQAALSSSAWLVGCACGCGAWLPASGPRPRVAYNDGHRPRAKRRAPKRDER